MGLDNLYREVDRLKQRGLPELERIIVPHPLGGLKPDAVREKVPQIIDDLFSALVAR